MESISCHITPLVINSLGGVHTNTHTYRCLHRNNFKKPGARRWRTPGLIIQQIKQQLLKRPHDYSNILIWAVCCTAFFGFLRCSEFTVPQEHEYDPTVHLSYKDVVVDCSRDPQITHIHIKQSNCSQVAANIWATTYYFTAKSFMHIIRIVLGGKARHSVASLSMAYKTFCGNLRTD